ncbi:MAG TPA: retropepsin-like aspartic protease [Chitinophagaceae bacterium]|nr:retropepsin-like aspartic protease [Chitinophagaceae bacterium]
MRFLYLTAAFICCVIISHAQFYNYNSGRTKQTGYFAALPYENIDGKLVIEAVIKHKKCRFIFDTGAPGCISKNLADELQLPVLSKQLITDANAKQDSMAIVTADITLQGITFNNTPTLVAGVLRLFDDLHVDGTIGSNMLHNSIVRISPREKLIYITDDRRKFALNKKQCVNMVLTPGQSLPFIWINMRNNKEMKELVEFDSGDGGFYVVALSHFNKYRDENLYTAVAEGNTGSDAGMFGSTGDTIVYAATVPYLSICGTAFNNVSVQTSFGNNSRIGAGFLRYGIVTLDYKNSKFYFEPFAAAQ